MKPPGFLVSGQASQWWPVRQEGKVELEEFCGKFFVPFDFSSPVATFTKTRSWLDMEEVL